MSGERAVNEGRRVGRGRVASSRDQSGSDFPNGQCDTEIGDELKQKPSHNWDRIGNGPSHMVLQHRPGPSPTLNAQEEDEVDLTLPDLSSLPREEAQLRVIKALEVVRERPKWLLAARACGLTHAEIAVVLGITEQTVRQAVKRAKDAQAKGAL